MHFMPRRLFALFILLFAGIQGCVTDVSRDARWRGGYDKGQTLRLRTDAYCYKFQYPCDYPRKCGLQITIDPLADPQDAAMSADWERLFEARVIARLPEGTRLRVETVEYAATFNTTTLVPHAVILDGPERGKNVSLLGISTDVRAPGYPNPLSPDMAIVEVVPDNERG
jgi:hypothetical protein